MNNLKNEELYRTLCGPFNTIEYKEFLEHRKEGKNTCLGICCLEIEEYFGLDSNHEDHCEKCRNMLDKEFGITQR